jgi:hypothetical protein
VKTMTGSQAVRKLRRKTAGVVGIGARALIKRCQVKTWNDFPGEVFRDKLDSV